MKTMKEVGPTTSENAAHEIERDSQKPTGKENPERASSRRKKDEQVFEEGAFAPSATEHPEQDSHEHASLSELLGKWKWPIIIVTALILIFGGFRIAANLIKAPKESTDKAVLTVSTSQAIPRKIHRHVKVTGTIWAWDPLTIGSEIGGLRIETVPVEEGDIVQKGQVLATLNSALIRADLEQKRAQLNHATINLEKTKQPNRPMDIARLRAALAQAQAVVSQEEANVTRAKANLRNASNNTKRYAALRKEGAVSAEDLDNRTTTEQTNRADLKNAEQRLTAARFAYDQAKEILKLALEGGMEEDIQMARAQISELQAAVKHDEAQLAQTVIRAPTDGLIIKRLAHIGDISVANEDMFQIVRENRFEVRAEVPEQDLAHLSSGQQVVFERAGHADQTIEGTVREISPLVDRDTRLATVRIDIPYKKGWLPGMFVSGLVDLGESEALTVPQVAVLDKDGRKIAFVLEPEKGQVFSKTIKPGERSGKYVEVLSGLEKGDRVVSRGAGFLKDGDHVRVQEK